MKTKFEIYKGTIPGLSLLPEKIEPDIFVEQSLMLSPLHEKCCGGLPGAPNVNTVQINIIKKNRIFLKIF